MATRYDKRDATYMLLARLPFTRFAPNLKPQSSSLRGVLQHECMSYGNMDVDVEPQRFRVAQET